MISMFKRLVSISLLPACVLLTATLAVAQSTASSDVAKTTEAATETNTTAATPMPVFTEYKGVKIGMTAEEVRKTLEQYLKAKGDAQDILVVADSESAQVFYDNESKVKAISIDYTNGASQAPTAMQVLGREVEPRADGSMYAVERYPAAGYWVSYNRTSGAKSMVTITIQAL